MRAVRLAARFATLAVFLSMAGQAFDVQAATGDRAAASEKCRGCHVSDSVTWKENYHGKMVRPVRDGLLKSAADNWTRDSKGAVGPRTGNVDGRAYGLDDVVMVVGSKWKQRYLVKLPGSDGHQFLDRQWNAYSRLWESYSNSEDWETVCGACHQKPNGMAEVSAPGPSPTSPVKHFSAGKKSQLSSTTQK